MKTAIFYDNETNGLPLFKEPSNHPDQPHIVQLAAVLVDLDTGNELQVMDRIIKPEGWLITQETVDITALRMSTPWTSSLMRRMQ